MRGLRIRIKYTNTMRSWGYPVYQLSNDPQTADMNQALDMKDIFKYNP